MLCFWLLAPLAAAELGPAPRPGPAAPRSLPEPGQISSSYRGKDHTVYYRSEYVPVPPAAAEKPAQMEVDGLSVLVVSSALAVLALTLRASASLAASLRLRGGGLARSLGLEMQLQAFRGEPQQVNEDAMSSLRTEAAAKIQRAWRGFLVSVGASRLLKNNVTLARYHEARSNPMFLPLLIAIERHVVDHLVGVEGVPKHAAQFMLFLLQRLPFDRDLPYKSLLLELIFSKALECSRRAPDTTERTTLGRLINHLGGGHPHGVVGRAADFGLRRALPAFALSKSLRSPGEKKLTLSLLPHETGPLHLV